MKKQSKWCNEIIKCDCGKPTYRGYVFCRMCFKKKEKKNKVLMQRRSLGKWGKVEECVQTYL